MSFLTQPTPPAGIHPSVEYKVVETSAVHDETLESILNEWVALGWSFDSIQFIQQPSARRPVMAFLFFTRPRASQTSLEFPDDSEADAAAD